MSPSRAKEIIDQINKYATPQRSLYPQLSQKLFTASFFSDEIYLRSSLMGRVMEWVKLPWESVLIERKIHNKVMEAIRAIAIFQPALLNTQHRILYQELADNPMVQIPENPFTGGIKDSDLDLQTLKKEKAELERQQTQKLYNQSLLRSLIPSPSQTTDLKSFMSLFSQSGEFEPYTIDSFIQYLNSFPEKASKNYRTLLPKIKQGLNSLQEWMKHLRPEGKPLPVEEHENKLREISCNIAREVQNLELSQSHIYCLRYGRHDITAAGLIKHLQLIPQKYLVNILSYFPD